MKRVLDGLSLIAIGFVLLACTTGYLHWSVWISIFSLWPLLLVSVGIDLIGKATGRDWLRAFSSVILIGGLLYGAFVMPAGTWGLPWSVGGPAQSFSSDTPHDSAATEGVAKVEAGATRLSLKAGPDLAAIQGTAPTGAAPTLLASVSGSKADVAVSQPRQTVVWVGGGPRERLDVTLDRAVRWTSLDINAGATQADIDLRDLNVEGFSAQSGASELTVTFGESARSVRAVISAGAASVTLRVPRDARVNLRLSGALTAADTPGDFQRISGIGLIGDTQWTGAGTGAALDITVKAGAASLAVERY